MAIRKELEVYHYDLVIPMNDDVAIILAQHKGGIEGINHSCGGGLGYIPDGFG